MKTKYLGLADLLELQWRQIREFGGSDGIRNSGSLRSALDSARAGSADQPPHEDVHEIAAVYLLHLVRNEPFVDGNKRTGLAAALQFLSLNGFKLTANEDALYDLVLSVAQGDSEQEKVAEFLRQNSQER